eukprot:s3256_g17.t1
MKGLAPNMELLDQLLQAVVTMGAMEVVAAVALEVVTLVAMEVLAVAAVEVVTLVAMEVVAVLAMEVVTLPVQVGHVAPLDWFEEVRVAWLNQML